MSGRFSEKAQMVMTLSREEAKRLQHRYIGTEHILLGLLREGNGVAARALNNLNVTLEEVRGEVKRNEELISNKSKAFKRNLEYTRGAKTVIEFAIEGARQMGHKHVGTEHLLLGLIMENEGEDSGAASKILRQLDVDTRKIREQIWKILDSESGNGDYLGDFKKKKVSWQSKSSSNTPTLDNFGIDLTELAKEEKLDPIVGREKELERIIQILNRRTKNNPCIVGEPGVGKTALAEGLAQKIIKGDVSHNLEGKRVINLELSNIVAGTKYRGEFEERLKKLVNEVAQANNIILFIDEVHNVVGAGAAEGAIDASNILKPALARGELQCIGATTLEEYRKYIERDPALERRFQVVNVDEPSSLEAIEVLKGLRDRYEAHHGVEMTDKAIEAAVNLSKRYISGRYLPDKAIDLIDEAGSSVRIENSIIFPEFEELKDLEKKLKELEKKKDRAIKNQDYEGATQIRDEKKILEQRVDEIKGECKDKEIPEKSEVSEEEIARVVSDWTGIPVERLTKEESEKLLEMENVLHERIVGQNEAVKAVSNAIRRSRAGIKDPKRPIGSFIFLGPSGVGKSELAKVLAKVLFDDEDAVIRVDMSEFMEGHTTSKLIGSPPGYVGYEEGGQLTEQVRTRPYSVILFDEIEKAHPEVFNSLLQVLEDGRLTDARGKVVDFKNTLIIMTSNVGANKIRSESKVGFSTNQESDSSYSEMKGKVLSELTTAFRPEFINRVDEILVFHALEKEHLMEIVDIMLDDLYERLKQFKMDLEVTDKAKELLAEKGYDPTYGARPLRRVIQKHIENNLSDRILRGEFSSGDKIIVDAIQEDKEEGRKLIFDKREKVLT